MVDFHDRLLHCTIACHLNTHWLQEWDKLVAKALGPKYTKLASESLMAISILVYVRLKLQDHLSGVATSYVATGADWPLECCMALL